MNITDLEIHIVCTARRYLHNSSATKTGHAFTHIIVDLQFKHLIWNRLINSRQTMAWTT